MKTYPLYLNGEFVTTDAHFPVNNAATGQPLAQMSAISRDRLAQAIADAQRAFSGWRALTALARGAHLHKIADELERRAGEISRTMTLESGKPLAQSVTEVAMSADHLRWFAEEARRGYGRVIPHQTDGKRNLVIKTPDGVVGAISPWNFPLVLSVRKVAPALAAGCPVILKPASYTPLCNVAFAEACRAAQLPKGVFQLAAGSAAEIAAEFLENPLVRKISFTGSTEVGSRLIAGAAAQIKLLSLELGGLNPVLVFDDADLEKAVEGTMLAKFRNSGQSCIAANRIYVQSGIYDRFVSLLAEKTSRLKVGDGLSPMCKSARSLMPTRSKRRRSTFKTPSSAGRGSYAAERPWTLQATFSRQPSWPMFRKRVSACGRRHSRPSPPWQNLKLNPKQSKRLTRRPLACLPMLLRAI